MDVEKKFKEIVSDIFDIKPEKIKKDMRFVEDLNAKSVDIIALVAATENEFGVKTTSYETRKNKTVGEAIKYVKKKLKK